MILADEPTGILLIPAQAREIMELFRRLDEQGTTIIQVTHSEANAAYGNRVVQLKDGWILDDTGTTKTAPRLKRPFRYLPGKKRLRSGES